MSRSSTPEQRGFGQREMVARSLHLAVDPAQRHGTYPLRKPVFCSICEQPAPHGPRCDGCSEVAA